MTEENQKKIRQEVKEFYAVWRGMNYVYNDWAKRHGLSFYQLYSLYAIWESKGLCTQKDICGQWLLPKQTVNTILKNYEEEGLITFHVSESDKRNKMIGLTDKGQEYADEVLGELTALETDVFRTMGAERSHELVENSRMFTELFESRIQEK